MKEVNDYFVPELDNFKIGYEYELLEKYGEELLWSKITITHFDDFNISSIEENLGDVLYEDDNLITSKIRVPYLTKEQIINEGWKYNYKGNWSDVYFKPSSNGRLELWHDETRETDFEIFIGKCCLYKGTCPSINEFRFICKLLKI